MTTRWQLRDLQIVVVMCYKIVACDAMVFGPIAQFFTSFLLFSILKSWKSIAK